MKYRLFLFVAKASVLGGTAFADSKGSLTSSKGWTWVSSIAAG